MSANKRFVETGAGRICYFADMAFPGRPTVVLLHGLSSNHTTWEVMQDRLHADRINSIAWDQRGHGHSDMRRRPSLYRFPRFSDDLLEVLKAEGVERATFVGYSYGGPVAVDFASRHPEMADGLVLVSANVVSPPVHMGLRLLSPLLYGFYMLLGSLLVWQSRKKYYYYKHGDASGYLQSTIRGYKTMPLSVNFWMLAQMFRLDYRPVLPRITAPVLIVRAQHDPFFSQAEADEMLSLLPDARLSSPQHASHFVASQAQDEIADMVITFI